MSTADISSATDPDLRASLAALQRAGKLAREAAMQTETSIVVVQDGQLIHISANELRAESTKE